MIDEAGNHCRYAQPEDHRYHRMRAGEAGCKGAIQMGHKVWSRAVKQKLEAMGHDGPTDQCCQQDQRCAPSFRDEKADQYQQGHKGQNRTTAQRSEFEEYLFNPCRVLMDLAFALAPRRRPSPSDQSRLSHPLIPDRQWLQIRAIRLSMSTPQTRVIIIFKLSGWASSRMRCEEGRGEEGPDEEE